MNYVNIGIFTGRIVVYGIMPHVLVVTSTADMGVDYPSTQLAVNNKVPYDVSTLIQRRGRAARCGKETTFITDTELLLYTQLIRCVINRLAMDGEQDVDAETSAAAFKNSDNVSPKRPTKPTPTKGKYEKQTLSTTNQDTLH
jgi:superfamily II DNA/RNA helicase